MGAILWRRREESPACPTHSRGGAAVGSPTCRGQEEPGGAAVGSPTCRGREEPGGAAAGPDDESTRRVGCPLQGHVSSRRAPVPLIAPSPQRIVIRVLAACSMLGGLVPYHRLQF